MPKLILSINTRNKSYNLLEDVYKDFGVVFHPKTPVIEVENFVKEKLNAKANSETSSEVRQSHNQREGFEGKTEKASGKKKADGVEFTQN